MHLPPPETTGLFHIVGIGGIGMSAIAEVMHTRGYDVQGSDLKESANLDRLRAHNIPCVIGHGFGLDPSTLAEVMLAASSRNVLPGLECVGPLKVVDTVATTRLDISSGSLPLPGGPGLGVTLDDQKLAQYRMH